MRKRAAEMRHETTQPERILWSLLRKSQLGELKFRRQAVIGPYVVDFCCPERRLVIQVDGVSHVGRAASDHQRTRFIEAQG
jgi:very-short-patch-repair endonuclease